MGLETAQGTESDVARELTPEEQEFAGYIMDTLALDESDLSLPITYKGMTTTIEGGVRHSIRHIIGEGMGEEEIRAYTDMLLALGRQQQADA